MLAQALAQTTTPEPTVPPAPPVEHLIVSPNWVDWATLLAAVLCVLLLLWLIKLIKDHHTHVITTGPAASNPLPPNPPRR